MQAWLFGSVVEQRDPQVEGTESLLLVLLYTPQPLHFAPCADGYPTGRRKSLPRWEEQWHKVGTVCSHGQRRYPPILTLAPKRTSTQRLLAPYTFFRTSAPSMNLSRFSSPIPS
jgi:hypothetical protein